MICSPKNIIFGLELIKVSFVFISSSLSPILKRNIHFVSSRNLFIQTGVEIPNNHLRHFNEAAD